MNTKMIAVIAIASILVGCGEDKVTNNDPAMVINAKMASICHGYYTNLLVYLDNNGNTLNDQKNLKVIAKDIDEVYEDALDNYLDEGAITDKIIEVDAERAEKEFAASPRSIYDTVHNRCGANLVSIMSPQELLKMTDSWQEE